MYDFLLKFYFFNVLFLEKFGQLFTLWRVGASRKGNFTWKFNYEGKTRERKSEQLPMARVKGV